MADSNSIQGMSQHCTIDTSEKEPSYLLIGKNGSHIKLSSSTYYLLQNVEAGVSFEVLATRFSRPDRQVAPSEIQAAYTKIIGQIVEIEANPQNKIPGSWLRIPLLPEAYVIAIARYLAVAFQPGVALGLVVVMIGSVTIFLIHQDCSLSFSMQGVWVSYLLFLVSSIVHEFGHASACLRYGARPSTIGFTMYLMYPAFYSDVSAAWKLKRWQRVIVDVGGIFFQLVVGSVYLVIYILSGWEPFSIAFMMIGYSCLFSLNPIFRFDGYWIIADALGVTNLGQQARRVLRHLLDRLRGKHVHSLPWSNKITWFLEFYMLTSISVWAYFVWVMLPLLWQRVIAYPALVSGVVRDWNPTAQAFPIERLHEILIPSLIVFIAMNMLYRGMRLFKPVYAWIWNSLRIFSSG